MHIETTIINMTKIKKIVTPPNAGEDIEKVDHSSRGAGNVECSLLWKAV